MSNIVYGSTKTYVHANGLSCCFRQWRAESHCEYLHGYAISVKLVFENDHLDHRNWVQDFGGLKPVKKWIEDTFDHKTLVAEDDPALDLFQRMNNHQGPGGKLIQLVIVPDVGCEAFAKYIFDYVEMWISQQPVVAQKGGGYTKPKLVMVEVREHEGNSAYVRVTK